MRHIETVSVALCALAFLLVAESGMAQAIPDEQIPGTRIEIRPADLPPPYATESSGNKSDDVDRPDPLPFRLPEGFSVNLFADDLHNPRWMVVASNGDVLLSEPRASQVTLLRDADGDGIAEERHDFAEGFDGPHGLAIEGNYLYIADVEAVWRVPYRPGDIEASADPEQVTADGALGNPGSHWSRNIVFAPDGSRFFVTVGSTKNVTIEGSPFATVQSFAADGSDQRDFATGLRNPVGIEFHPDTGELYVTVNERDGLGDDLVPDYFTRIERGDFFGWPYAYIGDNPQPGIEGPLGLIKSTKVPDVLFRAHSAALGLAFYEGKQFPDDYVGDAFVALRGSWNRSEPTGYMVVRVPFEDGRPAGYYESFLTGFWIAGTNPADVFGRPVGLAVAADGSLLIADDTGDAVWRVSYTGD
ncbi:MAG: PQQ-dependent sugar dehydrogenase [Rhodospirillaceae bacterium]|nr:PQQ-dependent sugar dehydrogenase [Rhodospirillaceae bacterium]